jgi:uncharacterized cupin superfamily protein
MEIRRVVTGIAPDGSATIVSDGPAPRVNDFVHSPGMSNGLVWATDEGDTLGSAAADRSLEAKFVPGPGGTRFAFVTFPPQSVFMSSDFDPVAAACEQAERSQGLAELFEPDAPGKHTTPSVDYVVVLDGELWLELDNGEETLLHPGDVVIQNATRHSWAVRGEAPATIACVLVGLPTA